MTKLLSIITPFYCSNEESYLNKRVDLFIEKSFYPSWMERIIVDFGSPSKIANRVELSCAKHGYVYLNLKKGRERFSAGKCRNYGAQIAKGEYLSFSDVDLLANEDFYSAVFKKINKNNEFNFFEILPCFYLTSEASVDYLDGSFTHDDVYSSYVNNDSLKIKATAPATSCFLLKKDFYLSEGGMRDEFFGHGYEDFELMNRLAIKSNKFYRSHNYYSHDYKYDSLEYKGYRTFFSLFGRENLAKGYYYVHIYHEPAEDAGYKESSKRNKSIFEDFMLSFDKNKDSPPALENNCIERNVLVLGWKNSIPFKGLREVIPLLGRIIYKHESDFHSSDNFVDLVQKEDIDVVFFLNPYGNDKRLDIYKKCQTENINFVVYDRGALPDSWFFDTCGFNAESKSYGQELWNRSLSGDEEFYVEKYISELCNSEDTLEANGSRQGSYSLRKKYDFLGRKMLFVPLQRPNDTVIKHFSGSVAGVDDFLMQVRNVAANLPPDWVVCIKQHPLESYRLDVPGCIVVDDKTHVHDLVEACDAVLLINSGVGLISLCFGKPVFCMGQSFYAGDGLAIRISSGEDVLNYIVNHENYEPDQKNVHKFVYYLISEFYSFAKSDYIKVADGSTGASRNMVVALQFSHIRIKGIVDKNISRRLELLSTKAPAYDYYRNYFYNKNSHSSSALPKREANIVSTIVSKDVSDSSKAKANAVAMSNASESIVVAKNSSTVNKKIKKLIRNPALFFKDAIKSRVG